MVEMVHMDHMVPFVQSKKRNQYLLILVDNLTKFVRLFATRRTLTKQMLLALQEFIFERVLPKIFITYICSFFTARAFGKFFSSRAMHLVLNSTRHPQANGQVERVNRTVLPVIMTSKKDPLQHDWDDKLTQVECSLTNSVNETSGKTPFKMLHEYQPRFHNVALKRVVEIVEPSREGPREMRERVRQCLVEEQKISKSAYDGRHIPA